MARPIRGPTRASAVASPQAGPLLRAAARRRDDESDNTVKIAVVGGLVRAKERRPGCS
jgi:hypothetical protein